MKKIIWSLDAYETSQNLIQNSVSALEFLSRFKNENIEIYPVYILSDGLLGLSVPTKSLIENFKPQAEKSLQSILSKIKNINLKPAQVITKNLSSTSDAAKALETFAKNKKADAIIVGSHARKGIKRMILGSFTETLLLFAKIPVIVVNPSTNIKKDFDSIMFATDFSKKSENLYKQVLKLATDLKAKLVLYHAIPYPSDPVLQSGVFLLGGGWLPVNEHLEKLAKDKIALGKKWVQAGKKSGVSVKLVIDNFVSSPATAILDAAQKNKTGMIALAAKSGSMASALLGSVTRQVVRNSSLPVWVIRN